MSIDSKRLLIYDGDCDFCMGSVHWLQRRGAASVIRFQDFQSAPPEMELAGITAEDCKKAAYLVDLSERTNPKVYRGAGAINYALRNLPCAENMAWRLLGYLYLIPGIRQIQNSVYLWITLNRSRIGDSGNSCSTE